MHAGAGTADTATGGASGLQALVYTSPMHEFDGGRGTFSPTTSTLIVGQREAVLIDAQFMASDVAALGDMIEDSGKELTAIYITHGTPIITSAWGRCSSGFPAPARPPPQAGSTTSPGIR